VGKGGEIKIGGKGLEELNKSPETLTKLLEQVQNKGNQLSTDKSNVDCCTITNVSERTT
jgi:hypothetical protein